MKYYDFEYDGINLSDYGFIVCSFSSSGVETVTAGSKISFTKVSHNRGLYYSLVNAEYTECLTTTFDICKAQCGSHATMKITNDEYRDLMRWLNRKQFCPFRLIPDVPAETDYIDTCYYNASFNVEKVKLNGDLIGLKLTLETDKPFGYGLRVVKTLNFAQANTSCVVYDNTDEVGEFYPDVKITVKESGNLYLYNETLDNLTIINNCSVDEVIVLYGKEQIIESSLSEHNISNDFNYGFLKIGNTFKNRKNVITSSLSCDIVLSYSPIIKDTP